MSDPFAVVRQFESALCEYTGAPYCVSTTSCTTALLLAVAWHLRDFPTVGHCTKGNQLGHLRPTVEIPKRTYVGVLMSIIHAGGRPTFRDEDWRGAYRLDPLPVWDSARRLRQAMYTSDDAWNGGQPVPQRTDAPAIAGAMVCLSFHWSKVLGIEQGGAILHEDPEADRWLRMARFDGRQEGVAPPDQQEWIIGYHAYMAPETAAKGLMRLSLLNGNEPDLPNSNYPDLSQMEIFK